MDWKELQENAKALGGIAAQKLNEATDTAALHLKLKTAEYRLQTLYASFGKAAFEHFTTDDGEGTEVITRYVEAIALQKREISQLQKEIRRRRAEKGAGEKTTAVEPTAKKE